MQSGLSAKYIRLAILLLAATSYAAFAAENKWIHMRSANFELYSGGGPRSARDTIRQFEQVRAFFGQALHGAPANPMPIRLVAFGSAKEFEPYRINEYAIAYYHQSLDRDYIVMSHGGADIFPVAVHEYVHLLARHTSLNLPPWLNEGMAELYSTLRPMGDKILIGALIEGRHQALLNEKWTPLAVILAAGHDSPYYNEKNKAGSLYNEGWALTHMLYFRAEYRSKFSDVLRTISAGKDSSEALQEIYGRPLDRIEKDLEAYLRGASFQGGLVSLKLEKAPDALPADPLSDFDRDLMLTDLNNRRGKEAEQKSALERLVALDPSRPEPYRGLGYLAFRQGNRADALRQFGSAFERGDRDPKLLWDYGRMLAPNRGPEAIHVFTELLAKLPDRLDVRIELAQAQLRADRAKEALATLAPIRTVTPAESARFFEVAVYAHLRDGDRGRAEATARRFREVAKTDEDREKAESLLRLATAPAVAGARLPAIETAPAEITDGGRPKLRRSSVATSPHPPPAEQKLARFTASGRFLELQCKGAQANMIVETPEGRKVFAIEDPTKVAITAGANGPVEMTCGVQKPIVSVEIGYERAAGNVTGIDGIVKSLSF